MPFGRCRDLLALALPVAVVAACFDSDVAAPVIASLDIRVPVDPTTAEAAVGTELTFSDGAFLGQEFAGGPLGATFTSGGTVDLEGAGEAIGAAVSYGSCTIAYPIGDPAATVAFDPCEFHLVANDEVEVGGTLVGTVTWTLGGASSDPATVTFGVRQNPDGTVTLVNARGQPWVTGAVTGGGFRTGGGSS